MHEFEKNTPFAHMSIIFEKYNSYDIPVLCTVLDPVFKFIAKGELSKVPCIGTQLSGVRFDLNFHYRYEVFE